MAHDPRVSKVLGFEPHPESSRVLNESVKKTPDGKVEIISKGVASTSGTAAFAPSTQAPAAAGIRFLSAADSGGVAIELCTQDDTVNVEAEPPIIVLVNIESGELGGLKGGLPSSNGHSRYSFLNTTA